MKRYKRILKEDVAQEILNQLGGHKFVVMTGAKNLVKDKNSLMFKLPRAKDGINYVKITLNGKDLYDVEFGRIQGVNYKVKKEFNDIYNDQLVDIFEKTTGLYTKLF